MIIISNFIDLTGQRFGRLTVIKRDDDAVNKNGRHRVRWECTCDCGNTVTVYGDNLRKGVSTSCGCYRKEKTTERSSTHKMTNSRLYRIWCAMKTRCYNPNSEHYQDYGGRGIAICNDWLNDFSTFQKWANENGYNQGLSIDRINNDCGYSPENCRWVGSDAQANNRRSNRVLTYNGETHNITEWAKLLNKSPKTLFTRLYSGWSVDKILST